MKNRIAKYNFSNIFFKRGEEPTLQNEHFFSSAGFIEFSCGENPIEKIEQKYGINGELEKQDDCWLGSERVDEHGRPNKRGEYSAQYQICLKIYEELLEQSEKDALIGAYEEIQHLSRCADHESHDSDNSEEEMNFQDGRYNGLIEALGLLTPIIQKLKKEGFK